MTQTQPVSVVQVEAYGRTRPTYSLCGDTLSARFSMTDEQVLAEHAERIHTIPEPGDFLTYTLVTDSRVVEVVKVSASGRTLTIRDTAEGDVIGKRRGVGGPYPVVYVETVSDPDRPTRTIRLRKDGTWRESWSGARPMRPAPRKDGRPFRVVDYHF